MISIFVDKKNLKQNENVDFLNPANTRDGFYVETGWTSIKSKIKVPTKNSEWKVKGNNILGNNNPVTMQWDNGEGIIFTKKIGTFFLTKSIFYFELVYLLSDPS